MGHAEQHISRDFEDARMMDFRDALDEQMAAEGRRLQRDYMNAWMQCDVTRKVDAPAYERREQSLLEMIADDVSGVEGGPLQSMIEFIASRCQAGDQNAFKLIKSICYAMAAQQSELMDHIDVEVL